MLPWQFAAAQAEVAQRKRADGPETRLSTLSRAPVGTAEISSLLARQRNTASGKLSSFAARAVLSSRGLVSTV
jgi:hypothetical protein